MKKIICYGILHETKGLIGMNKGKITFPNTVNKNQFTVGKTKMWNIWIDATNFLKDEKNASSLEDCEVVPITLEW